MKIIHTSDWHLGQEFYTYDRTDEHVAFLEQLQEIVAQEQPDALLIAGRHLPQRHTLQRSHAHVQ